MNTYLERFEEAVACVEDDPERAASIFATILAAIEKRLEQDDVPVSWLEGYGILRLCEMLASYIEAWRKDETNYGSADIAILSLRSSLKEVTEALGLS